MHASPPVEVRLCRHGRWQASVVGVVLATCAVVVSWIVMAEGGAVLKALVASVALLGSAAAVPLAFPADRILRWTGRCWQVAPVSMADGAVQDGDVRVALDFGSWMLLRFVPVGAGPGAATWLPVQRRGLENGWHGLRCALYAPRPASAAS